MADSKLWPKIQKFRILLIMVFGVDDIESDKLKLSDPRWRSKFQKFKGLQNFLMGILLDSRWQKKFINWKFRLQTFEVLKILENLKI